MQVHHRLLAGGIALFAVTLIAAVPAMAQTDRSMRCGTHLIYGGGGKDAADKYEVLKKCGEPLERYGYTWIYVQGNSTRTLTFDFHGKLQRIETRRN